MTDDRDDRHPSIDAATLTPLVRQVLGSETAEVTSWDAHQIHGGMAFGSVGGSAIHRFSGRAHDRSETVDWSLILKVLYPPEDRGQPTDHDYWRREACAYESGLLGDLPWGLTAPMCYGAVDQPSGECWIWLEDVRDDIGPDWPLEHYGVVARHLGQFNGAYLTGERPIPQYPWLRRNWLEQYVEEAADGFALLQRSLDHPLVRRCYPPDVLEGLLRTWEVRGRFVEQLDRLPQALCHYDAFRRNLFARRTRSGDVETVAIDWSMIGIGSVGQDIKALVRSTLTLEEVDVSQAQELDQMVFDGYLRGLHDAGWRGDPRLARFGQSGLGTMWSLGMIPWAVKVCLDESRHAQLEEARGLSMKEIVDDYAESLRHPPLTWERDAWELLEELGLDD